MALGDNNEIEVMAKSMTDTCSESDGESPELQGETSREMIKSGSDAEDYPDIPGPDPVTGDPRVEIVMDQRIIHAQKASESLKGILIRMGLSGRISVKVMQDSIYLNIQGAEPGLVIGHRGQNLDALQHVVNRMVNNKIKEMIPVTVDSDDYRHRRHQQLERMVYNIGKEVSATGEPVVTEPLTPSERRVFHIAATRLNGIRTASFGDGFFQPIRVFPGPVYRPANHYSNFSADASSVEELPDTDEMDATVSGQYEDKNLNGDE